MAKKLADWLKTNGYGALQHLEPVSGGSISESYRIHLNSGQTLFIKENASAPLDMFAAEAAGLDALAATNALKVPLVIHFEPQFIILEDLGQGLADKYYWRQLGAGLAALHSQQQAQFGFTINNYCGATPQDNTCSSDGIVFFGERRLLALATVAFEKKLLSVDALQQTQNIVSRLATLIPAMPAVLLHGDLWSGNAHCTATGQPALIDPATYWGWAEADLAMTELFGGFPAEFYSSYEDVSGMKSDWRDRAALYNLYHLFNHLLLFGSSYLSSINPILNRFAD